MSVTAGTGDILTGAVTSLVDRAVEHGDIAAGTIEPADLLRAISGVATAGPNSNVARRREADGGGADRRPFERIARQAVGCRSAPAAGPFGTRRYSRSFIQAAIALDRPISAEASRASSSVSKQTPTAPPLNHLTTATSRRVPQSRVTAVPTGREAGQSSFAPPGDRSRIWIAWRSPLA